MPIRESQLRRGQFRFLASQSPDRILFAVLAGIAGGIGYAVLVPLIVTSIAPTDPLLSDLLERDAVHVWGWEVRHPKFALAYVLLCLFVVLSRAASQVVFGQVLVKAAGGLRLYFAERIRQLPIAALESIGEARLVNALTLDITRMLEGAAVLPVLLINASTIAGALAFIAFQHARIFWLVVAVLVLGTLSYRLPLLLGQRFFRRARAYRDGVQESLRGQVYGAKELKLNPLKYEAFMNQGMREQEREIARAHNLGNVVFYLAIQYGNVVGLLAIGAVTYGAAAFYELRAEVLTGIVMAMLYVIGPVGIIVNAVPTLIQGRVALNALCDLLACMPVEDAAPASVPLVCRDLRFEQVTYRYGADGGFGVGPLDLHLRQGQVTFIVGGNGSGKSTLAKLLSCHYLPASGRILYDGVALDRDNLGRARLAASAIYLDFFLFPRLFSHSEADLAAAGRYLHRLGLGHKVSLEGDRFSTTDLSAGQRKRLALLTAYVENRNLYVFDEWAADQDPEFKHVFYTDILPAFRRQGKIVAVISHDDKYFSQADQIVWMEHGQIVRTERRAASGATAPPGEGNLTSQPEYSNERR